MRNEKLIAARDDREWTQEEAAERVGVDRVTYARWEEKGVIPRRSNIIDACKAFKMTPQQLGFKKPPSAPVRTDSVQFALAQNVTNGSSSVDMLTVGVRALIVAQHMYRCTLDELQALVAQEIRRLDDMERQNKTSRREAIRDVLSFLAGIPLALLGLETNNVATLSEEEILPLYVSGIPACWQLYFDGEIAEVEHVVSSYITHLSAAVHRIPKHQEMIASLASQAHQLASLVVLEHEDFRESLNHCDQALVYGKLTDNPNILLGAYIRRANTLYYHKRLSQMLQNYQEALQTVNIKAASPLIQGRVYSGFAGSLSFFDGHKQQALRYEGLARDVFPDHPEDDPSFSFTHASHYIINLNATNVHLNLGNPKAAEAAILQAAEYVPKTTNPRYIELLNYQALVAIAQNDLEQSCTHIETAIALSKSLGSDLYISDARSKVSDMPDHWKRESRVKELMELLR